MNKISPCMSTCSYLIDMTFKLTVISYIYTEIFNLFDSSHCAIETLILQLEADCAQRHTATFCCLPQRQFDNRAFAVAGPRAWNSLPPVLHSINSLTTFKKSLKTHLFN